MAVHRRFVDKEQLPICWPALQPLAQLRLEGVLLLGFRPQLTVARVTVVLVIVTIAQALRTQQDSCCYTKRA